MKKFEIFLQDWSFFGSPEGDFVRDALADKKMPDVKNWDQLEAYLMSQSASPSALDAAKKVWAVYAALL